MASKSADDDGFLGFTADTASPSEVRELILLEHRHLRGMLTKLEAAARALHEDPSIVNWCDARERAFTLLGRIRNHMELENAVLARALRDSDPYYGPVRAQRMIEEHASQAGRLEATVMLLEDRKQSPVALAQSLLELAAWIRDDMEEEERTLLDPKLLTDDIVVTDFYAG